MFGGEQLHDELERRRLAGVFEVWVLRDEDATRSERDSCYCWVCVHLKVCLYVSVCVYPVFFFYICGVQK